MLSPQRVTGARPSPARAHAGRGVAVLAVAASVLLAPMAGASPAAATDRPTPPTLSVPAGGPEVPAPVVAGKRIKDQWIVTFDPAASPAQVARTRQRARDGGAKISFDYRSALTGFAARLEPDALRALQTNPHVLAVEPDYQVQASATQSAPPSWGLDRLDQHALPLSKSYTYGPTGTGVTAYVLDTGVRTTHTDFGGRAREGFSAFNDGRGAQDCNGHGTHVAGTIGGTTYGVAKNVQIVAVRVLDCNGSGSSSGVVAGVDWVSAHASAAGGPAVANTSLGSTASTALDNAVVRAISTGIPYAVAAGNSNLDACGHSPARLPAAITVGATTSSDARASFSNYGPCLDLFAPGDRITSTVHSSDTATATYSGTSMASPHVAGVIATYLQDHPTASPAQVSTAIADASILDALTDPGPGSVNRLLSSSNLIGLPTTAPTAPAPNEPTAPANPPAPATAPVATSPRTTIVPGHRVAHAQVPVRVHWSATAFNGAGIVRYDAQRSSDGGRSWRTLTLPRTTSTSTTINLTPGTHRFRVRAIDTRALVGNWATGPEFSLRLKSQAAATYRGATRWKTAREPGALGGSVTRTRSAGATATVHLTAQHLSWVGTTAPNRGKAEILIDGKRHAVVDLYSTTTRTRTVLFTATLPPGPHVLTIRALGKARNAATNNYIDTDAFITQS